MPYVRALKWDNLVIPYSESHVLTPEFHANLKYATDDQVYVHGKYIDISPVTINTYYGIPHLEAPDDYTYYL